MKPLISYVPDDLIELCQNSLPAKDSGDVEDTFGVCSKPSYNI
jgi:hypothetical protein